MTRLAWFSPWPPAPDDAAVRSSAVVPALRARGFEIDLIRSTDEAANLPRREYDLAVYHLADAPAHDFVWPVVFKRPGLTVLHEGRLHRARSRVLLAESRTAEYRAEFVWNHPHVAPAIAELAIAGCDGPFSVQWPMVRAVIAASRLTATHAAGAVNLLLEEDQPERPIDYIPASDGSMAPPSGHEGRARLRASLGWPPSAVIVGVFGPLGLASRVPQILRAFSAVRAKAPEARLLLAGPREAGADADIDVDEMVRSLGLESFVRIMASTGEPHAALSTDAVAAATDVTLALRWPPALDMPGALLRALAAGQAAVILDLVHLSNIPTLDPRTWRRFTPADRSDAADAAAVGVAVDVMDEDHSLRLALHRLAIDAELRQRLGRAARAYWEAEHAPDRMVEGYVRAIRRAMALPAPHASLPAHLQPS